MLVQFAVKNYRSFKKETVLDMMAIKSYKEHLYNLYDLGDYGQSLKVTALYGANASGKSNFIEALRTFQRIVLTSLNQGEVLNHSVISLNYHPYEFTTRKASTMFEIILIHGNYEYTYGFEYDRKVVLAEWLYRKDIGLKRKANSIIFERDGSSVSFGASVRSFMDKYEMQIPKDALVLSFANRLSMERTVFQDVFDLITKNTFVYFTEFFENKAAFENLLVSTIDNGKAGLLNFLHSIDSGISDIFYDRRGGTVSFYTHHLVNSSRPFKLDLYDESSGTIKCLYIYIATNIAIHVGGLMVVDELDAKLHPLLLKFIIDQFNAADSGAQLVYTVHDTTLMDKRFFRRDQIWFVQKDERGCSTLYPLSDFKVRSDASFEKDYLAGVYGGIPILKDYQF